MGFTKKEMEDQGFTAEQIAWAMAERGKEIETAKAETEKLKVAISEKETTITELSEKVKGLDGTETKVKELTDKISAYEKSEADRKAAEEQAKLDAELRQRFLANVGENKFKHEDIENGRFAAFKNALADEKYKGKGDAEIFTEVTKDMDCFVNPQQQTITMPGGSGSNRTTDALAQARAIMGLPSENK